MRSKLTHETPDGYQLNRSILRVFFILFCSEWLIMELVPFLNIDSSDWLEVLIDASLVTLTAAPITYFWGLKPLRGNRPATHWFLTKHSLSKSDDDHATDISLGIVVTFFGIIVFTVESSIMLFMQLFRVDQHASRSFADALLLGLIGVPIFYFLIRKGWAEKKNAHEESRVSLQKRFGNIFIPLFALLLVVGFVVYIVGFDNSKNELIEKASFRLDLVKREMRKRVEEGKVHLISLGHSSSTREYLQYGENEQHLMVSEYLEHLKIETNYTRVCMLNLAGQVRFCLSADGLEKGGDIQISLQASQYLEQILAYAEDEVLVYPYQKDAVDDTGASRSELGFRFATPLLDSNDAKSAILVIEYNSAVITDELISHADRRIGQFTLLDEHGKTLFSSSGDIRQASVYNQALTTSGLAPLDFFNLSREQPSVSAFLNPGAQLQRSRLKYHQNDGKSLPHNLRSPTWHLVMHLPRVSNNPDFRQFGSNLIYLLFILTPLLAGGSGVLAQAQHMRHSAERDSQESNQHLKKTVRTLAEEMKARQLVEADLIIANEVFQNTSQGIVVTSRSGVIRSINPAFTEITGFSSDDAIGEHIRVIQSGKVDQSYYGKMWHALQDKGSWYVDINTRHKNGSFYPQQGNINAVFDEAGNITDFIYIFTDASAIKESERHLERLTNYDVLTDLPNRLLLLERLEQACKSANHVKKSIGVLYLDLYLFKRINDSFGFDTGDAVLKTIATRLAEVIDSTGTLGRISDDEFVIITGPMKGNDGFDVVTKNIMATISQPIGLGDHEIKMSANVGITIYPLDDSDANGLLNNANTALLRAKQRGVNRFDYFNKDMGEASARQLSVENALRRAIENEELVLYYQPQVCIESEKIIGLEALIRWPNISSGQITSPLDFIPMAEETGLIIPLGEWILRSACQQSIAWQRAGYDPVRIGVNISAIQFKEAGFVNMVHEILHDTGLEPDLLDLELTEGIIMEDEEGTIRILEELNSMGVKLSIDDFGTGYSSLSYLKRFPVHMLKIDRSFIQGITSSSDDLAITDTITQLGKNLGMTIIAEGVEDKEQLEVLRSQKCDMIQGFLFSRAVPAEEIGVLLKKQLRSDQEQTFTA